MTLARRTAVLMATALVVVTAIVVAMIAAVLGRRALRAQLAIDAMTITIISPDKPRWMSIGLEQ